MKVGKALWIIVSIAIVTIVVTLFLFTWKYACGCHKFLPEQLGQFGDFYGGILGTLITFISIYFIYRAYSVQQEAYNVQQQELELAKKSADLEILNRLYSELVEGINNIEYRRVKTNPNETSPEESEIFRGVDALYNFDETFMNNRNSVLNSLNGILVSFDQTISMINKVKYKYADMKEIMLTKVYFLYYSKILWPVYSHILDKHRDALLAMKQPNAQTLFSNYERLTRETYKFLISKGYVERPSEPKILAIINSAENSKV
jgi:uncharacterized membrane protein